MTVFLRYAMWLCMLWAGHALADDLRPASLAITADGRDVYQVLWKVPAKGGSRLALDVGFDDSVEIISPVRQQFSNGAHIESWRIQRAGGLAGMRVSILGLDASYTDILLRATEHDQTVVSAVMTAEHPHYTFSEGSASVHTVSSYLVLGFEHILIGLDHLLFVACLVYLSGSKRKLFWTITGFTLAHSVTLVMAALGWVRIAIPPVEASIALSIVFLAREIARNDSRSMSVQYPVVVAASFGLLHGFGFASVLADIGLPATHAVWALLLFNVGVELGQLAFVLVLLVLARILSSMFAWVSPARLRLLVSYLSGSIAFIWLVTRLSAF